MLLWDCMISLEMSTQPAGSISYRPGFKKRKFNKQTKKKKNTKWKTAWIGLSNLEVFCSWYYCLLAWIWAVNSWGGGCVFFVFSCLPAQAPIVPYSLSFSQYLSLSECSWRLARTNPRGGERAHKGACWRSSLGCCKGSPLLPPLPFGVLVHCFVPRTVPTRVRRGRRLYRGEGRREL